MGLPLLNDAGSCADCLCTRGCPCHVGNAAKTAVALDCTAGPAGEYRPCRRLLDGSSYQRERSALGRDGGDLKAWSLDKLRTKALVGPN